MMNKRRTTMYLILAAVAVVAVALYLIIPKYLADEVYPMKYADLIKKYSAQYGVDPALVAAVILQESRFNPNAKSPVGAQGLMQFMPGTAATMAKETGHWPNYNIFDAETSIEFGAAHLRDLLNKYHGDVDQALAGYNAGTGTVDRWVRANIFERIISGNTGGETVNYVRKVKNYRNVYATMYAEQLGLQTEVELRQTPPADTQAQVRGFVWSRIFSNIFSFGG